jgi:hypothetical protein
VVICTPTDTHADLIERFVLARGRRCSARSRSTSTPSASKSACMPVVDEGQAAR